MDSALNERCQDPAWLERKDRHRGKVGAGFAPRSRLLEADPLRGVPREQEQDRDDVDHWCVTPVPWALLARPSSVAGPSGGHRGGRRSEPVKVPQHGLDEADEGCATAAVGPER